MPVQLEFYKPDPNSPTVVDNQGNYVSKEDYKRITGQNDVSDDKINWGYVKPGAPGSTPAAGNLPPLAQPQQSPLGNIRSALREALNEAGRRRLESNFSQVSPIASNLPPGSMGGVVDLIRNSVKTPIESVFSDVLDAKAEEEKMAAERQKTALTTISMLAESGAMLGMTPDALMVIEEQAGLPQGTSLAWKARLEKATKMEDEKAQLELKLIQTQIQENLAQAGSANRANRESANAVTSGFKDSKIESDVRGDVVSLRQQVARKEISESQALQTLRTLYSPGEATDQALLNIWGVQAIGSQDIGQISPQSTTKSSTGNTPSTFANTPYTSTPVQKGTVITSKEGAKKTEQDQYYADLVAHANAVKAAYNATRDPNERNKLKNEMRTIPQTYNGKPVHDGNLTK